jgi:RNA polymerase sigma factor (TIGR02999 family)
MNELSSVLERACTGDLAAYNEAFKVLYGDLQRLVRARLSKGGRNLALDTSALINETYLRLAPMSGLRLEDRSYFLAYASRAIRSVIVDLARAHGAARRGGDSHQVTLKTQIGDQSDGMEEIILVNEALEELAAIDPRIVEVVEMRYLRRLERKTGRRGSRH